jgi:threonine aldolase
MNQPDGSLSLEDIAGAIRSDDPHEPITRLVCLENTHNGCGGVYQSPDYVAWVSAYAHERGILVHLDGARLFNAVVAQGVTPKELTGPVDSVTFCLSKGLCAPVGSVLCGSRGFIARAVRLRKMVGGGMRQAGILAAAGIVALETMIQRLGEDHARARDLADGLRRLPGLDLAAETPATNMVFLSLKPEVKFTTDGFIQKLKDNGILIGATGERSFRLVTHYWINDEGVEKAIASFREALK